MVETESGAVRTIRKGRAEFRVAADERYREFWDFYASDAWERETVAVFERFLGPDVAYLDLGAWIGPTVLLAAPAVRRVVCVEPDPVARDALERNLALNAEAAAKTVVVAAAAASREGTATLASPAGGDSLSTLVGYVDAATTWSVPTVAIEAVLESAEIGAGDFIKLDVEGAEYEIVPAMARFLRKRRPTVYLATHPNLLLDKSSLARRLRTSLQALRLNWRLLRALRTYRHHYVYDTERGRFADVRRRNVLRTVLPLPLRSSFLVGAYLFTDVDLTRASDSGRRGTRPPAA